MENIWEVLVCAVLNPENADSTIKPDRGKMDLWRKELFAVSVEKPKDLMFRRPDFMFICAEIFTVRVYLSKNCLHSCQNFSSFVLIVYLT